MELDYLEKRNFVIKKAATEDQLRVIEDEFKVELSPDYRELLLTTNGIFDAFGSSFIWTVDRVINDNNIFRNHTTLNELYEPFEDILFIADAGNGDQFGLPIMNDKILSNCIVVWNHDNDERGKKVMSINEFIDSWTRGELKV